MPYKQSSNPLSRKTSPLRRSPFKNTNPALQGVSDDEHRRISSTNDKYSIMLDGSTYDAEFDAATNTKEDAEKVMRQEGNPVLREKVEYVNPPGEQNISMQEGGVVEAKSKPEDIIKNVTSTILETSKLTPVGLSGGKVGGLDQLRPTTTVKPNVDMDSKLVNKALSSIDAANNENLSADDRNIAERRARRQLARAQRKEIRKTQPRGKERREAIKKTRENQGRKEENMVSD
jgi:hypothetical protein